MHAALTNHNHRHGSDQRSSDITCDTRFKNSIKEPTGFALILNGVVVRAATANNSPCSRIKQACEVAMTGTEDSLNLTSGGSRSLPSRQQVLHRCVL